MTDEVRQSILKARAERLARRSGDAQERTLRDRVAVVRAGGERYGLRATAIREIVALPRVTPLPATRLPCLRGLTQVRGDLIGVLDLGQWLGHTREDARWLVVLAAGGSALGLAVEEVDTFRDVFEDELVPDFGRGHTAANRPVHAVTRDLVALLDLDRLLADPAALR